MFKWLNSIRAISVFLIVGAVVVGFMIGRLNESNFLQIATVIVGAYFIKRDDKKDRE